METVAREKSVSENEIARLTFKPLDEMSKKELKSTIRGLFFFLTQSQQVMGSIALHAEEKFTNVTNNADIAKDVSRAYQLIRNGLKQYQKRQAKEHGSVQETQSKVE